MVHGNSVVAITNKQFDDAIFPSFSQNMKAAAAVLHENVIFKTDYRVLSFNSFQRKANYLSKGAHGALKGVSGRCS